MKIKDLNIEYDKLQKRYGDKDLASIYNGGCEENPDICFVFMNPTGKNISSSKEWQGRRYQKYLEIILRNRIIR